MGSIESPTPVPPSAAVPQSPEALARLVLRCRELEAFAARVRGSLPSRSETPFLHRQLEDALHRLHASLKSLGLDSLHEWEEKSGLMRLLSGKSRRSPAPQPLYDLQGTAWTIPVTELVDFLSHSGKSGVLWVTTAIETFVLEFARGSLVHAISNAPPAAFRLGEILLREHMLKPCELESDIAGARAADDMLGSYLVRSGRLSAQDLQRALSIQVQELFHRLMEAENATYGFQEGLQLPRAQELAVNITQLLLESARKKDEERQRSETDAARPDPPVGAAAPAETASEPDLGVLTDIEEPPALEAQKSVDASTSREPAPAAPLPSATSLSAQPRDEQRAEAKEAAPGTNPAVENASSPGE